MRKLLLLFITSILLLSGCGSQAANDAANPYELKVDSEVLSIYDDQTKFEENDFKTFYEGISLSEDDDFVGFMTCESNCILIKNNVVSAITVHDENTITYKSISPGDDNSKIEDAYEYDHKYVYDDGDLSYTIFFDENGKELKNEEAETAKAYSISYRVHNSKIQFITICLENKSE